MKLLIAILAKDDKDETVRRLTSEGFMLTEMGTTGGFLKRKNTTLLIGAQEHSVARIKEILRQTAGKRSLRYFQSAAPAPSGPATGPGAMQANGPSVQLETEVGGCTVFELNADAMYKL